MTTPPGQGWIGRSFDPRLLKEDFIRVNIKNNNVSLG